MLHQKCPSGGQIASETPSIHTWFSDWPAVKRWERNHLNFSHWLSFFFHSLRNYFCLFSCEQPSAALWIPSKRDGLKMCAVILVFKHDHNLPFIYDGWLFTPPSSVAVLNSCKHLISTWSGDMLYELGLYEHNPTLKLCVSELCCTQGLYVYFAWCKTTQCRHKTSSTAEMLKWCLVSDIVLHVHEYLFYCCFMCM